MALLNPSFENAGALPGEAEHWTLSATTSLEQLAGFGTEPEDAWEDFERWFDLHASMIDVPVVLAFFDGDLKGYEAFEPGWTNAAFLYDLPAGQLVTATFNGGGVEDFETGWSNVPYMLGWELVTTVPGVFDGEPREDFESQVFLWTWEAVAAEVALFDAGSRSAEAFDGGWPTARTL